MALALAFREMACFSNGASCSLETCESTQELTQNLKAAYRVRSGSASHRHLGCGEGGAVWSWSTDIQRCSLKQGLRSNEDGNENRVPRLN
ncbi:hypothetical protein BT96DRAFT_322838 [Gymnopus androsaceus JB14]|uniref:Uncharacterized protein n=1 Tax=Gymnopus androsaceus JB14 TaxID=1447944 RepID=A0A6A4GJX6_9AGAR|nr:hypothetical protein BT96DRAFT_560396 [Gymnopus androsaceus JB14]KAE9391018.1 hypothetical protein BT96DRAFT_322838 [Gymnopus androsaceus JB14]